MKKILSLTLVLLMCLSAFVACDNSDASSSSSSSSKSESASSSETESSSVNTTPATDEVVYYDEIKDFKLKDDAPSSAVYKNYTELLTVLEEPIEGFDESIFEENYVVLIKNIEVSTVNDEIGFTGFSCECIHDASKGYEGLRFMLEWHTITYTDIDQLTWIIHSSFLVVVPITDFYIDDSIDFEMEYSYDYTDNVLVIRKIHEMKKFE